MGVIPQPGDEIYALILKLGQSFHVFFALSVSHLIYYLCFDSDYV